jgi:alpha-N-arabinofuranosidase
MNVFERSGALVEMTAVSDLVNGWSGGIIQASRHALFVTPTYHAIRLYNEHLGRDRLAVRVSSPTFDSTAEGTRVPVLDVVASRSADGRRLFVKAVNTGRDRALQTEVAISGATAGADGTAHTLTADSLEAANSFRTPDAVAVQTASVRTGPKFSLELPPHSVTVVTIPLVGGGNSKPSSNGR